MTDSDTALRVTQKEMDECCPCSPEWGSCSDDGPCMHLACGVGPSKDIPFQAVDCHWPGHAALKRRDAAVRWATLTGIDRSTLTQLHEAHREELESARREYEEVKG